FFTPIFYWHNVHVGFAEISSENSKIEFFRVDYLFRRVKQSGKTYQTDEKLCQKLLFYYKILLY
ncbi:MAG: hypothetical protein CSB24_01570, partial [Deltaproteobacteria bacterium]